MGLREMLELMKQRKREKKGMPSDRVGKALLPPAQQERDGS